MESIENATSLENSKKRKSGQKSSYTPLVPSPRSYRHSSKGTSGRGSHNNNKQSVQLPSHMYTVCATSRMKNDGRTFRVDDRHRKGSESCYPLASPQNNVLDLETIPVPEHHNVQVNQIYAPLSHRDKTIQIQPSIGSISSVPSKNEPMLVENIKIPKNVQGIHMNKIKILVPNMPATSCGGFGEQSPPSFLPSTNSVLNTWNVDGSSCNLKGEARMTMMGDSHCKETDHNIGQEKHKDPNSM